MRCIRCEEGTLVKIQFKETGKRAYLCDFCESLWLEGMDISLGTGFMLNSYQRGVEREYTLDEIDEKDQNHKSVHYVRYK